MWTDEQGSAGLSKSVNPATSWLYFLLSKSPKPVIIPGPFYSTTQCCYYSANPANDMTLVYTLVSSASKRPIRSMFFSIVALHVISFAHSSGNQPLSPSLSLSPSYHPSLTFW